MTKPINDYNGPNKFRLGQLVQTKSGLVGKVIGYAEYKTGWEYRIKVEGKKNTMYRKQEELKVPTKKKKTSTKKNFEKGRMAYIMKYYGDKEPVSLGDLFSKNQRKKKSR